MGNAKSEKKILIYSPYWNTMGGGEKYLLEIALALGEKHRIYLVADKNLKEKAYTAFGFNLENIEFLDPRIFKGKLFYSRYLHLREFDICFYMTDGSLFFPGAGKNYLVIQSPHHIPKLSLSARFKISGWKLICYSSFMHKIIKTKLGKHSFVLPPAVDTEKFKPSLVKEKIIISVGRFFDSALHEKKHDFLIGFFNENFRKYFKGWRLYICGNLTEGSGNKVVKRLKNQITNPSIKLYVNLSFKNLLNNYRKSAIYWHAAGYGSDPLKFPEKMEHFGITTIEAMATGSVPVIFAEGGQTDIVDNNQNGLHWHNTEDFLMANLKLINKPQFLRKLSAGAVLKSKLFSVMTFRERLNEIIK